MLLDQKHHFPGRPSKFFDLEIAKGDDAVKAKPQSRRNMSNVKSVDTTSKQVQILDDDPNQSKSDKSQNRQRYSTIPTQCNGSSIVVKVGKHRSSSRSNESGKNMSSNKDRQQNSSSHRQSSIDFDNFSKSDNENQHSSIQSNDNRIRHTTKIESRFKSSDDIVVVNEKPASHCILASSSTGSFHSSHKRQESKSKEASTNNRKLVVHRNTTYSNNNTSKEFHKTERCNSRSYSSDPTLPVNVSNRIISKNRDRPRRNPIENQISSTDKIFKDQNAGERSRSKHYSSSNTKKSSTKSKTSGKDATKKRDIVKFSSPAMGTESRIKSSSKSSHPDQKNSEGRREILKCDKIDRSSGRRTFSKSGHNSRPKTETDFSGKTFLSKVFLIAKFSISAN
jgi:hypothetical protein